MWIVAEGYQAQSSSSGTSSKAASSSFALKVEGDGNAVIYRIVGFDEQTAELETLLPGDSVAIQGRLEIESKDKKIVGIFIVAMQTMALRKRSINRLPVGSAPRAAAAL